jgi:hypothetical protein
MRTRKKRKQNLFNTVILWAMVPLFKPHHVGRHFVGNLIGSLYFIREDVVDFAAWLKFS